MQFLAISAALFVAAGAIPALVPAASNSTLPKADPSSAGSVLALIAGDNVPTKRDNALDAVTRAIDDLENSVLSLGGLLNSAPSKRDDNSVTSVAGQAVDGDQLTAGNTANLVNERSEKRDNTLYVVTRAIDNIENTILALGKLTNDSPTSKRETDINTKEKRDNFLDVITRAIDDLENSMLALGSLFNGNTGSKVKRMDNTASAVIQGAIDDIQSAIAALASLTTSN